MQQRRLLLKAAADDIIMQLWTHQSNANAIINYVLATRSSSGFSTIRSPCTPVASYAMPPSQSRSILNASHPAGKLALRLIHAAVGSGAAPPAAAEAAANPAPPVPVVVDTPSIE